MKDQERIVDMCIAAYVQVMGAEMWNRLTAQQQHDAIMIMIKDMNRAMDKINDALMIMIKDMNRAAE